MKLLTEMRPEQRVALELYLKVDDDYRPPSYSELSSQMLESGYSVSSSTLQRWAKSCDFEEYLTQHINALILADKENNEALDSAAGEENFKRTLLSLADNNELTSGSYAGLKLLLKQILNSASNGGKISKDDAKLLVQIYSISSARDDKLLDRKTFLDAADKITKADLMKELAGTGIEMEEVKELENNKAIDAEFEIEE